MSAAGVIFTLNWDHSALRDRHRWVNHRHPLCLVQGDPYAQSVNVTCSVEGELSRDGFTRPEWKYSLRKVVWLYTVVVQAVGDLDTRNNPE